LLAGILLAAKADLEHRDAQNWTPLLHACNGAFAVGPLVRKLVEAKADLEVVNADGQVLRC